MATMGTGMNKERIVGRRGVGEREGKNDWYINVEYCRRTSNRKFKSSGSWPRARSRHSAVRYILPWRGYWAKGVVAAVAEGGGGITFVRAKSQVRNYPSIPFLFLDIERVPLRTTIPSIVYKLIQIQREFQKCPQGLKLIYIGAIGNFLLCILWNRMILEDA